MGRPPCCDKSNVKRGLWTPEEDAKLLAYVSNHGIGNWTLVPKKAGLNRCGKSCRLRWTNYLRPDLKHDNFTPQEEEFIINLHGAIGSRWSLIAKRLPGRTDNDVKNYWNTKLRKKLMKIGIDPVTHKPVSQVLSDLGSISGLPNSTNQMSFPNKDLKTNMVPTKTEPSCSKKSIVDQTHQEKLQSWQQQHKVQQYHQVINQENINNIQQHVFTTETASSSSSSSSPNLTRLSSPQSCQTSKTQITTTPPCSSSFDWSEFLQNDPFVWSEIQQLQQGDLQRVMSSLNLSGLMQSEGNEVSNNVNNEDEKKRGIREGSEVVACDASMEYQVKKQCEGYATSGNSFVDGILDRDSEIRAAFPELLDASFEY